VPAAATPDAYLAALPEDRRTALTTLRTAIRTHLPAGYDEEMQFGGISYVVPLARLPDTYNGKPLAFLTIASQKNHMALYLMCTYGDATRHDAFVAAWTQTGKRLDMGKACVRFKKLDELALDVVCATISTISVDDYIATYRATRAAAKA
jgi:hypothetical protein